MPRGGKRKDVGKDGDTLMADEEQGIWSPAASQPKRMKTPKKKKSKDDAAGEEDISLFEVVRKGRAATAVTVAEWVSEYESDSQEATLKLFNFLVRASGCLAEIDGERYWEEDADVPDLIDELANDEAFQKLGTTYPVVSRAPKLKRFRTNFLEFWDKLVAKCQREILYDDFLLNSLQACLIPFASSKYRPFRHTATLVGLQLISSLTAAISALKDELKVTRRQMKAESKKKAKRKSTALKKHKAHAGELQKRIAVLEEEIDEVFNGLFIHRWKDTEPKIRGDCIEALGHWIMINPLAWLDDQHLKYLGWAAHDKSAHVRLCAIRALGQLYSKESDFVTHLENFTDRFIDRIVQMRLDKDVSVALAAIDVLGMCASLELLSDEHITLVSNLITDASSDIRSAVASFVKDNIFDGVIAEGDKGDRSKGKKASDRARLKGLVDFIEENYPDALPNYIVDAMWEHTPIFQDWKAISGLLLSDDLSEDSQVLLVQLLNISAKESKRKKEAQEKHAEESKKELTRLLAKALPKLFSKFKADGDVIAELAQIPQFFDLQIYKSDRLKSDFNELVKSLTDAFLGHSSESVLSACTKTWQHILTGASDAGGSKETKAHFAGLEESLLEALEDIGIPETKQDMLEHPLTTDQEERLRSTLARIYHLSTLHDVSRMPVFEGVLELLDAYATYTLTSPETAQVEVSLLFNLLLWKLSHAKAAIHANEIDDPSILEVVAHRKDLQITLSKIYADPESTLDADVQLKAFEVFCDISVAFKHDEEAEAVTTSTIREDTAEAIKDYFGAQMRREAPDVDDEDEQAKFEADRCKVVTALSKAVAYGGLPKSLAPLILVELHRQGKTCGKVISYFMGRIREFDTFSSSRSADIILAALKSLFVAYEGTDDEDEENSAFAEFKKFTMKLALTFGVGVERARSTIVVIIEEGVKYAMGNDKRYMFFNALNRFLSNLRSDYIPDFQRISEKLSAAVDVSSVQPDEDMPAHAPYFTFKEHLDRLVNKKAVSSSRKRRPTQPSESEEETSEREVVGGRSSPAKKRKSARGRRRSRQREDDSSE